MNYIFLVSALFYSSLLASNRDPFSLAAGKHLYTYCGVGEMGVHRCALIAVDGECYCVQIEQAFAGHRLIEIRDESVFLRDEFGKEHRILFQKKDPST